MGDKRHISSYLTVARSVRVREPVGACRFFASVKGIVNEEEAKGFIAAISEEFRDATHNAWAYKLGVGDQALVRSSDDGEPANSAGPPIEQAIEGAGVTNVVVVVTRYFGGVKLGVGGLIRAYRGTAVRGLEEAGKVKHVVYQKISVGPLDYSQIGDVIHHVESHKGEILNIKYGQTVEVIAKVKPREIKQLRVAIRDATRGQARLQVGDMLWQRAK